MLQFSLVVAPVARFWESTRLEDRAAATPMYSAFLAMLVLLAAAALAACLRPTGGGSGAKAASAALRHTGSGEDVELDVAACWANKFGRFKHAGLRDDPLDESLGLPEYSVEPLDIPLGDIPDDERAALEEFRRRVTDLSGQTRTDGSTLQRYLRARKGNVNAAEKYFRTAYAWRKARGVERCLLEWNLEAYERCLAPWWLSGGFLGHGLKGEQVAYERLARCDFPRLMNMMPWEQLEKLDVVHCMRSLAACEEDALRHGRPMGSGMLVTDCEGFTWAHATLTAARSLNRLVNNRNMVMPECITRILVVRAPPALVYAWSMFKHIVDPGIRDKIKVVGAGESLELLKQYISPDYIPAFLGGRKRIDGDPHCRKVLAPGGPLPEEALRRFLLLAQQPGPGQRRALSPRSAKTGGGRDAACATCGLCHQQ